MCMAEFDAKRRNLDKFLTWLEKRKEGSKEGDGKGKDEVHALSSRGEQIEVKKVNVPTNRESQRLSTAAMVKLLVATK